MLDAFHCFADDRRKRYRSVIARAYLAALLEDGHNVGLLEKLRRSALSVRAAKNGCKWLRHDVGAFLENSRVKTVGPG
jgi:hypothetical protein